MKRKIMAVLLLLAMIVGLFSACKANSADQSDISSLAFSEEETTSATLSTTASEALPTVTTAPKTTAKPTSNKTQTTATVKETTTPSDTVSVEVQVEETIITDEEIEEPATFEPVKEIEFNNHHTAIDEQAYYQYASLGEKEKKLYNSIVDTISRSASVVNTAKLVVSYDETVSVFQKVLADYPQYFYISRSCMLAYGSRGETIRAIILLYTDGTVTDEFDEKMNLLQSADRALINEKIQSLEAKVEEIIAQIPADTAEVVKEKRIHDYIAETVTYDYDAAENADSYTLTIPHAFDLYGAAIEGLAVCEGYAKLFQYLCYSVGIQSTQVMGISEDSNHMWNAVLIDSAWYQIDVTWNDSNRITSYNYFNLTDEQMGKDHEVNAQLVSVPLCNSTENNFLNTFAVVIRDLNQGPTDYETAISNIKEAGDKRIYIYFEGFEPDRAGMLQAAQYEMYVRQHILWSSSDFSVYLSSQGIILANTMSRSNEFIVLTRRQ